MTTDEHTALLAAVRTVHGFPHEGIAFKDLSPVLADPTLFAFAARALAEVATEVADGRPIDAFAGVDSRGFLFAALAASLGGVGCLLVRKQGKLPEPTLSRPASMEYGDVALCVNPDLFRGRRIVVVDDVMATGGTAIAASLLAREAGATVLGAAFFAELVELGGCARFTAETGLPTGSVLGL